jgi:hypothetical protein
MNTTCDMLCIKYFKKFTKRELPLCTHVLVTGKSGSGKTQILWAYMLFFRACNFHFTVDNDYISLYNEIGSIIDSNLEGVSSWGSFVKSHHHAAKFQANFMGESLYFKLKVNGTIQLSPSTLRYRKPRGGIAYAYMGSSYRFTIKTKRTRQLTSFDQSLRHKYSTLKEPYKKEIFEGITSLFKNICSIKEGGNYKIYFGKKLDDDDDDDDDDGDDDDDDDDGGDDDVHDSSESEDSDVNYNGYDSDCIIEGKSEVLFLEVMFQNSSIQKVFASLILLFALVQHTFNGVPPIARYYLIDDPEVYLGNNVFEKYLELLYNLSEKYRIHMIIATKERKKTAQGVFLDYIHAGRVKKLGLYKKHNKNHNK